MNKVVVKPEGREGIWLLSPLEAEKLVKTQLGKGRYIHHQYANGSPMIVGADWTRSEAYKYFRESGNICALLTEPNFSMGHQLVVINKDKGERSQFDVGSVTVDMLEVVK